MMIRAQRRKLLNKVALSHNKKVLIAELSNSTDGFFDLKNKGKCPGVIHALSGKVEDEIDIVLDGKIVKNLTKAANYKTETVYI